MAPSSGQPTLPIPSFAETPDERARMGRISGVLWTISAIVAAIACFLPGSQHAGTGWVLGLSALVFLYGVSSAAGWIPWDRASIRSLGIGMALTIPVVGVALYLTGGALSYVEPMLVGSLLYAAFFFPARWAWPLLIELILVAGTPLLYDGNAIDEAFLPRYLALVASFLAATWVMMGLKGRLVEAELHQRDIAHRDALTGIGNRRRFEAILKRELAVRRRSAEDGRGQEQTPLALLIVDLDDFKEVNDNHGHPVGDAVLCQVAERTQSTLRATDVLARIGGDEFAVIAPGLGGEEARNMAGSIRSAIGTHYSDSGTPAPSASVGWASFPEDGADFEALIRAADERMLRSKRVAEPAPG
jgi:diguanylate cyclase (GGDEF)-like protein